MKTPPLECDAKVFGHRAARFQYAGSRTPLRRCQRVPRILQGAKNGVETRCQELRCTRKQSSYYQVERRKPFERHHVGGRSSDTSSRSALQPEASLSSTGTSIGHCASTRSTCACNVATVTRRPPHSSERARITGRPDAASKRHKHRPLRIDSLHLCLQRRHGHREERSRNALPQEVADTCVRKVSTGGEAQAT